MTPDTETPNRRLPSLVQLCQRVAALHVESIDSFDDDMSFDLVRPMLEYCSADHLLRLEGSTANLDAMTNDLWKTLCYRHHPIDASKRNEEQPQEPPSWRDEFFTLRAIEARRFEEIGSRIRSQRLEAEGRKREKEIKFTSTPPPAKRARGWNGTAQPKSLFQKTRTEATKVQKSMFGPQLRPPMLTAKSYSKPALTPLLSPPPSIKSAPYPSGSRVIVKAYHPRSHHETSLETSDTTTSASLHSLSPTSSHSSSSSIDPRAAPRPISVTHTASTGNFTVDNAWLPPTHSSPTPSPPKPPLGANNLRFTPEGEACLQALPSRTPYMYVTPSEAQSPSCKHTKKPARSALFMPKHRAHSQLPSGARGTA
ncbi:uncharacterized protein STEHIDRAFT_166141 [Stereum hirsutum FP-91666 SS1]|uniref:uncharacterized protein n=1 Tax=Stereum hirsutum (strain FP-91666) TaxID=721885 RepID=UPI000440BF9B|nr:uncharacterized protein STEHIDRAFT_166141 [Stereum hirsutum FP-91666 SS1]EIM89821.1 hypothetical protein STEHIDRAFT_166141 [Stereum hirsutum FP-91666 SS1]